MWQFGLAMNWLFGVALLEGKRTRFFKMGGTINFRLLAFQLNLLQ